MTSAKLRSIASPTSSGGSDDPPPPPPTIHDDERLGPIQVRVISAAEAFGRPSTLAAEADRYLAQVFFRDRTLDEEMDADLAKPRPV